MRRFGVLLMAGLAALLGAAELDVNIHPLGGNVRGFGVLAEYPAGGPKRLKLVRTTRPGGDKAGRITIGAGRTSAHCGFSIPPGNW